MPTGRGGGEQRRQLEVQLADDLAESAREGGEGSLSRSTGVKWVSKRSRSDASGTYRSSAMARYGADPASMASSAAQARRRTEEEGSLSTRLMRDGRCRRYGESARKRLQCVYRSFGSFCEGKEAQRGGVGEMQAEAHHGESAKTR